LREACSQACCGTGFWLGLDALGSPYGHMLMGLLPGLARPAALAHEAHAWNRLAGMTLLPLV